MKPEVILDKKKMSTTGENTGKYHVKIRAYFPTVVDGKKTSVPRFAKTFVYMDEVEFERYTKGGKLSVALEQKRKDVLTVARKAETVCEIPNLSGDRFVQLVEGKGNFENVIGIFDWYIGEMQVEDEETGEAREGNGIAFANAKNFFIRYKGSNYIPFAEINVDWLRSCKAWALNGEKNEDGTWRRKPITTASFFMYCRALRRILRLAATTFHKIPLESVPFGDKQAGKFPIPGTSKKKRKIKMDLSLQALVNEKNKILAHTSERDTVTRALNYWKAGYFAYGANMADVLRWKIGWYDKELKMIEFHRKKTENTEEDSESIQVLVGTELEEIIKREGNKSLDPEEYIFPVLKKGMTSAQRKKAVIDHINDMNKRLKTAAKEIGNLKITLSSGSSRYLVSTILERYGIPGSVRKDLQGHNTEQMQEHYATPYLIEMRQNVNKLLSVG